MNSSNKHIDPKSKATWRLTRQKIKGENKGYHVLSKLSYYDPKTKKRKYLESRIVGWVPTEETPFEQMVPTEPKAPKKTASQTEVMSPVPEVPDSQVTYPFSLPLLVIMFAIMGGFTSSRQIAEYWKKNRETFSVWFPEFPDLEFSVENLRLLIAMLGTDDAGELMEELAEPLMSELKEKLEFSEGHATGSSKSKKKTAPILEVRETNRFLTLSQKLIKTERDKLFHATKLLDSLQIQGATVVADPLDEHVEVTFEIVSQGADYIVALRPSNTDLFLPVIDLFYRDAKPMIRTASKVEIEPEVIETSSIKVMPGSNLPPDLANSCMGLEEGCLIEAKKEQENKKEGTHSGRARFFFSSIPYESEDKESQRILLETLSSLIWQHWNVENRDSWFLDIVFEKDRIKLMNPEYLKGRAFLESEAWSLLTMAEEVENTRDGEQ